MWEIYCNGKPANEKGFPHLKGYGWTQEVFTTWEAAVKYARNWLGQWDTLPALLEDEQPRHFKHVYSEKNVIEIRRLK